MFIDFRGAGEEGERERSIDVREKHRLVSSHMHPTRGRTHKLTMCPDQESNPQPFGV